MFGEVSASRGTVGLGWMHGGEGGAEDWVLGGWSWPRLELRDSRAVFQRVVVIIYLRVRAVLGVQSGSSACRSLREFLPVGRCLLVQEREQVTILQALRARR